MAELGTQRQATLEEAVDLASNVEPEEKAKIKELLSKAKSITILVTGKTGAGKSSLLNYILGANLFEVGVSRCNRHTKEVSCHTITRNEILITAWDSPGLQDGLGYEDDYLADMAKKCPVVDVVYYCISMEETRQDEHNHKAAICTITKKFGAKFWENALFVLTHANMLVDALESKDVQNLTEEFDKKVQQWKEVIQDALKKFNVPEEIVKEIRVVPAGHHRVVDLPGIEYWISNVWANGLLTMKPDAQLAMIKMEADTGFVTEENVNKEALSKAKPTERKIVFTPGVKTAVGTGVTVGGVGAAIGGVVGGLIGTFAIGIPTFGTAAVAGLGIGVGVGAAVGASVGAAVGAVFALFKKRKSKK